MIKGMSQNEEIEVNKNGGKQSKMGYGFHLADPKAMFRLSEVLYKGVNKYERDNWRKISAEEHLNHALAHAYAWMAKDGQDDHAGHFFCRAMMFLAMDITEKESK
ncbi:MAG: dATP/dGTP diphosphohydrolase domain-containing protein [Clostridia bacterium]|jgi:hypothetical protein